MRHDCVVKTPKRPLVEFALCKGIHDTYVILSVCVCVHASVVVCVCWCCCGVAGLSQAFCVALSYVKLHLRPRLCLAQLSVLSCGPAPLVLFVVFS